MQRFIFIQLLCHLTPGEEESVSSSEFFMFLPATPKKTASAVNWLRLSSCHHRVGQLTSGEEAASGVETRNSQRVTHCHVHVDASAEMDAPIQCFITCAKKCLNLSNRSTGGGSRHCYNIPPGAYQRAYNV